MSLPKRINAKARVANCQVIVAGPAATGKTCLIERFVNNVFAADDATHGPTLGCDCLQKAVFIDDTEVHLFLYDTAGQERFADMAASYYRVGEVCLLCFDMSDVSTFDRTQFWKKKVSDHNPKCLFILVGTKEDLLSEETCAPFLERWLRSFGLSPLVLV
ncbi:unnamed protein product [Cladocopium goreaui]|uniref:Ras-like GTP-binding protein RYL2 n=1 Tax=Cladocopium goreaui TaxID=2562237 RepID=A0A9P1M5J4_9DINO|nr:unnamed protein product [Cladocopium goreaui]